PSPQRRSHRCTDPAHGLATCPETPGGILWPAAPERPECGARSSSPCVIQTGKKSNRLLTESARLCASTVLGHPDPGPPHKMCLCLPHSYILQVHTALVQLLPEVHHISHHQQRRGF